MRSAPHAYAISYPNDEEVSLSVLKADGTQQTIKHFREYSFTSNLLTPSDAFTFTIGDPTSEIQDLLVPGTKVQLAINDIPQCAGYIDATEITTSRNGRELVLEGRDVLSQAVDAVADSTVSVKEGQTLAQVLVDLFGPFGWSKPEHFVISNEANRSLQSAQPAALVRPGSTRSPRGAARNAKRPSPKKLAELQMKQNRPFPREGVFDFACRIAHRFGLWIWPSADGKKLIVGRPDFDQAPAFALQTSFDGGTAGILESRVRRDIADQPTVIVADAATGGGEHAKGRAKVIIVNEAVKGPGDPLESLRGYLAAGAVLDLDSPTFSDPMPVPRQRPLFLHDGNSNTMANLTAFARRELALLQRKSLSVSYTLMGHGFTTPGGFHPWTVDTTVSVEDESSALFETLYVLGRTFTKSRSAGTKTRLELIRLHTLSFEPPEKLGSKAPIAA